MAKDRPSKARARVTLDLGDELAKRLRVHGVQTGRSESALVRELLAANLPRYVVQERSRENGKSGTDR